MIHFLCDNCKRALKVKDEDAGKKCKCKCGAMAQIPGIENDPDPVDEVAEIEKNVEVLDKLPVQLMTSSVVPSPRKRSKFASELNSADNEYRLKKRTNYATRAKLFADVIGTLTIIVTVIAVLFTVSSSQDSSYNTGYAVGMIIGGCVTTVLLTSITGLLADISSSLNNPK